MVVVEERPEERQEEEHQEEERQEEEHQEEEHQEEERQEVKNRISPFQPRLAQRRYLRAKGLRIR